jgi:hypothetical protein
MFVFICGTWVCVFSNFSHSLSLSLSLWVFSSPALLPSYARPTPPAGPPPTPRSWDPRSTPPPSRSVPVHVVNPSCQPPIASHCAVLALFLFNVSLFCLFVSSNLLRDGTTRTTPQTATTLGTPTASLAGSCAPRRAITRCALHHQATCSHTRQLNFPSHSPPPPNSFGSLTHPP